MQHLTGSFLKALAASGASAALFAFGILPAAAHGAHTPHSAATRTYAAPHYRAATRTYAAPHYRAATRTYAAPHYRAATRTYAAPHYRAATRTYAAPHYRAATRTYAAPHYRAATRTYAAPHYRAATRTYAAPHYTVTRHKQAAPAHFARTAPVRSYRTYHRSAAYRAYRASQRFASHATRRYAAPAPFVQRVRVAPRTTVRGNAAPFVETVNVPHHVRRYAVARTIVTSPLMRAVYAPRRRASVAYHPAYLTGRVIRITPQTVVLQPPTGTAVAVNCGCGDRASDFYRRFRTGTFATVPAVYSNGSYYAYGYSPQYYPQVAQWYSNYYGTPVTYSNGYYVPQTTYYGGSSWDNDADDAAGGSPYYGSYGYGPGYAGGTWDNDADDAQYAAAPTPYDSCMWSDDDNDGDGSCAGAQPAGYYGTYGTPYGYSNNGYSGYNGYGYNNYGYNGAYAAQQLQGLVVAKTGSILMVLGGNGFKPVIVDAAPALQNGFAVNGPVAVGQVIDAYGYYNGDTFTATALM